MMKKKLQHKLRATMFRHKKANVTALHMASSYQTVCRILNQSKGKIDKI